MLSPPHRHTSPPIDQQQGSASTVCNHARLVPVLFPPSGCDGRAEQTSKRKKRENKGEGCRRNLRQFLASLLFRLLHPPSTPSPAAHHFARLVQRSGKRRAATSSASVRCHRHHIATTSQPIDQQPANSRAAPRAVGHPASLVLFPVIFPASGGEVGKSKGANRTGRERTRAKVAADIFARSSLPSSYAVPVILRHDLVRSLSSVRPSVFLFLVPRSPSFRLTAKPTPAAHYLTSSHPRQCWKGSTRPVLVVIPSPPTRHQPATGTGGPLPDLLPASPSPSGRW